MNDKNKELQKVIDQVKERLRHYDLRKRITVGKKNVFVVKVNEVYSLKTVKGKTKMCNPLDASLFTKSVADEIFANAKFVNQVGEPVKIDGVILAEKYFSELMADAKETIKILEQTIETLESEGK